MKTLNLHCDYIKFKALKKALKNIDELSVKQNLEGESKDCLVVFIAVEKNDSDSLVQKLADDVKKISSDVKTKNIVLYPYAHLSSNLAKPETAISILKKVKEELVKSFSVVSAPFGYYKEFELKVKGHPLSELSRDFTEAEIKAESGEKVKTDEKYDEKQLLRQISKSKLDTSKLKDNDHRILGQRLDLFSFHDVAPGMVFWHNSGLIIRNELINFWREEHKKAEYKEIETPQILDRKLWQISGHWEKYKDNIFLTQYEDRIFAVKPMNCPGGMLVYKSTQKSYRDLPLRVAELGIVHRQELSGVLAGLFRVIKFTQDDAHIFCTEKQVEDEIEKIIALIDKFYKKFNLQFDHVELSTRPEKRIGSDKIWDTAEETLGNVLKKRKMNYKVNLGDGAFYGPKIDFHVKDSLNRTWQLSTIQLDFAMPERFELEYADKDGKVKRPIMIHRVVYGSLERFIGILLEHTNGSLPLWLSPIQLRVLSFTDRNIDACKKFILEIAKVLPNIRLDADFSSTTVNEKVRNAELMKIPYIITIGDKEEEKETIAVRERGNKKLQIVKPGEFIKKIKEKMEKRE